MSLFPTSLGSVEACGALQEVGGTTPREAVAVSGFVEPAVVGRILALGREARIEAVKRGKQLVARGLLAVDPERIARVILDETAL